MLVAVLGPGLSALSASSDGRRNSLLIVRGGGSHEAHNGEYDGGDSEELHTVADLKVPETRVNLRWAVGPVYMLRKVRS